jgi:hypothetical protein
MEHAEVQREHDQHERVESDPEPDVRFHLPAGSIKKKKARPYATKIVS